METTKESPTVKEFLHDLFLDYWNNYLTVEKFASAHDISVKDMDKLIDIARNSYKKEYG